MTANDIVKYLGEILNINANNQLVVQDILSDLNKINDLPKFRLFIKERFNYDRFKYLTGYQKFIALVNEYNKENICLNELEDYKVRSYADTLFSRVTTIFDEIDYRVKIGMDINDKKISKLLYLEFGQDDKALLVLNKIGRRQDILDLMLRDREGLKSKIKGITVRLSLEKKYPHLAIEKKSSEQLVLERLKRWKH